MPGTVDQALAALPRAETADAAGAVTAQDGKLSSNRVSGLYGWVLFPREVVARIEISVDGRWVGRARPGVARPDLAPLAPMPEAGLSGFEFWVEPHHIPPDVEHVTVGVCVMGMEGTVAWITREIEVDRGAVLPARINRVAADEELADDLAMLRERVQRRLDARPPSPTYPLRVLVMTHSLALGGAQLFLLEVIRLISSEMGAKCSVVGYADGPLRDILEREDVPVHIQEHDRGQDPIVYEGRMLDLAAWAALHNCNAVLANTTDAFFAVDLAARMGIPAAWFIHESYDLATWWGLAYGDTGSYMWSRMLQAMRNVDAAIFEAEATRRQYLGLGSEQRFVTAHYGIMLDEVDSYREHLDRTEARRQLDIAEQATVVLCAGTIEPRKGQAALALAFAELAEEFPDAVLVLLGETELDWVEDLNHELRRFACRAGLESRLLVLPLTTDPYRWLTAADILVMASDVESLPRVVLEAMAFELPVLATSIFGLPEVIEDGRTGYLCEPGDIGALRDALRRVLAAEPEEREAVGRAAAEHVRRHNDARRYALWLGNVLQRVAAEPNAVPDMSLAGP